MANRLQHTIENGNAAQAEDDDLKSVVTGIAQTKAPGRARPVVPQFDSGVEALILRLKGSSWLATATIFD